MEDMLEREAKKIANIGESRFEGVVSVAANPPRLSEQAKAELRRAQEARDAAAAKAHTIRLG